MGAGGEGFSGRLQPESPGKQLVLALALLISSIILAQSPPALATQATPVPSALCDTAPRSQQELSALLALAATDIATPAATTGGATVLEGTPVGPADEAAMAMVIGQWLACQNAGEPLRAWTLFSDGDPYRLLSRQGGLTEDGYALLATPTPSESEPAQLLEIRDQRELPDGRLGATVIITYPSVPLPKRFFFYFTKRDDRLHIDGILGEISFSVP